MPPPIQRLVSRGTTLRALQRSMQAIAANVADGGNLIGGGSSGASYSTTRVYDPSVTSIGSAAWTLLSWQVEDWDTDGWFDTGSNPSRITVNADGDYMAVAKVSWAVAGTAADMAIALKKNGALTFRPTQSGKLSTTLVTSIGLVFPIQLTANDYVEIEVYQADPNPVSLSGTSGEWDNWFVLYKLGAQ